jgi:hypothetical protein
MTVADLITALRAALPAASAAQRQEIHAIVGVADLHTRLAEKEAEIARLRSEREEMTAILGRGSYTAVGVTSSGGGMVGGGAASSSKHGWNSRNPPWTEERCLMYYLEHPELPTDWDKDETVWGPTSRDRGIFARWLFGQSYNPGDSSGKVDVSGCANLSHVVDKINRHYKDLRSKMKRGKGMNVVIRPTESVTDMAMLVIDGNLILKEKRFAFEYDPVTEEAGRFLGVLTADEENIIPA